MPDSLTTVIKDLQKKYGPYSVTWGVEASHLETRRISTGSLAVDIETGGGWAQGRIQEIYGNPSSGKTFLVLTTVAQAQKDFPNAIIAWVKFEPFDIDWARIVGVDTDRLLIVEPANLEKGLDIAEALVRSGELFMLVIDSWGSMCPGVELEGSMEDNTMGLRARQGNKFIRKLVHLLNSLDPNLSPTTTLIINQTYKTIGGYGDPDVTPGGVGLKFGSAIRMKMRKTDQEYLDAGEKSVMVAQETEFFTEKNKTFTPKRRGRFWFATKDSRKAPLGQIWRLGEILDYAVAYGIILKAGSWMTFPDAVGGEKVQGEPGLIRWAESKDASAIDTLEQLVREETLRNVKYAEHTTREEDG
jgi:recombination protein RecA